MATQIYQSIHTAQDIDDGIVLQKTTENSQVGIRLLSENATNHGDIGQDAIDLSYSSNSSTTRGATGDNSFAIGDNTTASGIASIATGDTNTSSGTVSFTSGANNIADGFASAAFGTSTKSMNINSFCLGTFNDGTNSSTVFEVGIGANDATRKNALEILVDGKVIAPELTEALIINPRSITTKEYVDNHDTGLKRYTDDDTNYGWGFQCRIDLPTNYGSIGHGAVCFTSSLSASSTIGATGRHAFAGGRETTASGTSATALGQVTVASGSDSLATGFNTIASGGGAFATGNYTIADNHYQTCIGQFNTAEELTSIFEVGIGTSDVARANGLEVYKDGSVMAPELSTGLISAGDGNLLVTKDYLELAAAALNGSGDDSFTTLDLIVEGDLTVQGITTTINTDTLQVEDKNIELGKVTTPTDITADGGGITLLGDTNKTIIWSNATDSWDFNQNLSITGNIEVTGTVDGVDIAAEETRLANTSGTNTGDQSGADIKIAYEAEADTNAFTDADVTKLGAIDAGASNFGKFIDSSISISHNDTAISQDDGTDNKNIAIGSSAGQYVTSGSNNIFLGNSAGQGDSTLKMLSADNIAVGVNAGQNLYLGSQNTFIGKDCGVGNSTNGINSIGNTAIGYLSLNYVTTGGDNTTIGRSAGHYVTTGTRNILIGHGAGAGNLTDKVTGSENTCIGPYSGLGLTSGSRNVCIGWRAGDALTTESSKLKIANNGTTALIDGDFTAETLTINGTQDVTGALRSGVSTLTDGATVAVDMSTSSNFELATTQDFTLSNPTGLVAGQRGYISITQDATGSRLLTLGTNYKTIGGAGITLTTAASALDVLRYEVISATLIVVELLADIK